MFSPTIHHSFTTHLLFLSPQSPYFSTIKYFYLLLILFLIETIRNKSCSPWMIPLTGLSRDALDELLTLTVRNACQACSVCFLPLGCPGMGCPRCTPPRCCQVAPPSVLTFLPALDNPGLGCVKLI